MSDALQAIFEQGVTAHRNGRVDLAEQLYRQVLSEKPDHAPALSNLGSIFVARNQLQDALNAYQGAIKADPNRPDGYYNLANLLRKLGRLGEAEALYRKSLATDADFARSHHNLGLVLGQMGRWNEAIPCYENALRLDPQFVEAHNLLGQSLMQAGKLDAAISRFQRYTRVQATDPRGFHNLALALTQKGMTEPAKQALEAALKIKPDYAEAYNARAIIRWQAGEAKEAIADWRQAVSIQPNNPEFLANLGAVAEEAGDLDHAIASMKKALVNFPNNPAMHSALLRLTSSISIPPDELFAEHLKWAERFAEPVYPKVLPKVVNPDPQRILNVGYVMGEVPPADARAFHEKLFKSHNREKVKVVALVNSRSEATLRWAKAGADLVFSIQGLNTVEIESLLQSDKMKIDILVDLSGHSPGNRLGLFAQKTVPIQASLFGYPVTSGMRAIDYRLTDAYADPPGSTEPFYSERLWRLPQVSWAYQPSANADEPGPNPFERNGHITYGVFQTPRRIITGMIELWANILKADPTARLKMVLGKNAFAKERFQQLFAQQQIDTNRIDFLPRQDEKSFFGLFREIDISLDTFPANGRLTTADALYMGVPVVTLSARVGLSRQGMSLLRLVDLNDLAAWKPNDYVEAAVKLAKNRERLTQLRTTLRPKLLASPLCNWPNFIRDLETAYRGMWQRAIG